MCHRKVLEGVNCESILVCLHVKEKLLLLVQLYASQPLIPTFSQPGTAKHMDEG